MWQSTVEVRPLIQLGNSSLLPSQRYVAVQFLSHKCLSFVVEVKSRTCELWERVTSYLGIPDPNLFGLALLLDGDFIFLDPETKLSKYAAKPWKSSKTGLSSQGQPLFVLHLRIRFHVDCTFLVKNNITRHHYYLQLRENVIRQPHVDAIEQYFILASFALQADLGDYHSATHNSPYFLPQDYFPQGVLDEVGLEYVHLHTPLLHQEQKGLNRWEAELKFIKEASFAHNVHLYYLRNKKDELKPSVVIGISTKGIHIYEASCLHKRNLSSVLHWSSIVKLSFEKKKFEIRASGSETDVQKSTLYTNSDIKAKHILYLCKITHQFSLAHQSQSGDAKGSDSGTSTPSDVIPNLPNVKLSLPRDVNTCSDHRISLVSSISSNTTSGIVADKVQTTDDSEDDLEIEILLKSPPTPSLESLTLSDLEGQRDDPKSLPKKITSYKQLNCRQLGTTEQFSGDPRNDTSRPSSVPASNAIQENTTFRCPSVPVSNNKNVSLNHEAVKCERNSEPGSSPRSGSTLRSRLSLIQQDVANSLSTTSGWSSVQGGASQSPVEVVDNSAPLSRIPHPQADVHCCTGSLSEPHLYKTSFSDDEDDVVPDDDGGHPCEDEIFVSQYCCDCPGCADVSDTDEETENGEVFHAKASNVPPEAVGNPDGAATPSLLPGSHKDGEERSPRPNSFIKTSMLTTENLDLRATRTNPGDSPCNNYVQFYDCRHSSLSVCSDQATVDDGDQQIDFLVTNSGTYPSKLSVSNTFDTDSDYVQVPVLEDRFAKFMEKNSEHSESAGSDKAPPKALNQNEASALFINAKPEINVLTAHASEVPTHIRSFASPAVPTSQNLRSGSNHASTLPLSRSLSGNPNVLGVPLPPIPNSNESLCSTTPRKWKYGISEITKRLGRQQSGLVKTYKPSDLNPSTANVIVSSNNYLDVHSSHSPRNVKTAFSEHSKHIVQSVSKSPSLATVYTNQVQQSQIEEFKQQLYSDVDYVIYPHKDPVISQQEYMDAKNSSLMAAVSLQALPAPPPYHPPSAHLKSSPIFKSTPVLHNLSHPPISSPPQVPCNLTPYDLLTASTHSSYSSSSQNLSSQGDGCSTYYQILNNGHYDCNSYYKAPSSRTASSLSLSSSSQNLYGYGYETASGYSTGSMGSEYTTSSQSLAGSYDPIHVERQCHDWPVRLARDNYGYSESCFPPPPQPPGDLNISNNTHIQNSSSTKLETSNLDINTLREQSRALNLPLITALFNDKTLLPPAAPSEIQPKNPKARRPSSQGQFTDIQAKVSLNPGDTSDLRRNLNSQIVISKGAHNHGGSRYVGSRTSSRAHETGKITTVPSSYNNAKLVSEKKGKKQALLPNITKSKHSYSISDPKTARYPPGYISRQMLPPKTPPVIKPHQHYPQTQMKRVVEDTPIS